MESVLCRKKDRWEKRRVDAANNEEVGDESCAFQYESQAIGHFSYVVAACYDDVAPSSAADVDADLRAAS